MSYFSDDEYSEDLRRNSAFQALNAIREAVSLAKRTHQPITYEQTLDLIHDLNADVYEEISDLLARKNESDWVKFFKEKAAALSIDGEEITPSEVIEKELKELEEIVAKDKSKRFLNKRILNYKAALEYFQPRKVSEHKILNRDFYLAERPDFKVSETLYKDDEYVDYKLQDDRILRLRLLHPDKPEHIIGADLIYEQFNLATNQARFLVLQYKTWNMSSLNLSSGNIASQFEKLDNNICKSGFCSNSKGKRTSKGYRFPYCSAFLRPTSYIVSGDSKLVSTGIHVPICEVLKIKETNKSLNKKNSKGKAISYKIFDELYVENMLGSRWLTFKELEEFYDSKEILSYTNRIRVHAQEVKID
ncbi:hypothetical protein MG296_14305 [Flavobacteriaceae bacterium TK19130]|nr:hypothetical protein [Thermobacterium salinum]